jgi:hypothetical protein
VTLRRFLLVGLLVYVTLDLSLPAMPGAFVFEPSGSVESAHGGRTRPVANVHAQAPPPPCILPAAPAPMATREGRRCLRPAHRLAHGTVTGLPRAALAPPPVSEDPH